MVVVNGVESDPGSAKDRVLLLRSPYLVVAGALAAAQALRARLIVVGTADALVARSVSEAAAADPVLARLVRVMEVPDRFVSGESGALISAMNAPAAAPFAPDPRQPPRAGGAADPAVQRGDVRAACGAGHARARGVRHDW